MTFQAMLRAITAFILIYRSTAAETTDNDHALVCCQDLSSLLPHKVFFGNDQTYSDALRTYYAGQEGDLHPNCIIKPESADDTSVAIKYVGDSDRRGCNFAVRGGGHTSFAGSANIAQGITIDLGAMQDVTVHSGDAVTSVGGGARWVDVYQKLDALNLAVSGGRSNLVGVGGLTTGGGISFYSPRKGFVCDNVLNYEIVIANGTILNVNRQSHSDLLKALRGGSNNFGVVTRFDLQTFSQGKLWGGDIVYSNSATPELLSAFVEFGGQDDYDEYAALFISNTYLSDQQQYVAVATPIYTKPVANPPAFEAFTRIQPQITDSLRIDVLGSYTNVTASAAAVGQRNAFITTTFKNDLSFLNYVISLWESNAADLTKVSGLTYTMLNQHLLPIVISKTAALGGNSLGLQSSDGPLILSLLSITWANAADDEAVISAASELIEQIESAARQRGIFNEYKYLNYAYAGQAVFDGYGQGNRRYLQDISRLYDPQGVFQRRVPGGFKLFPASDIDDSY